MGTISSPALSNGTFLLRRLLQHNAIDPTRIDALQRDGILTRADFELAVAEGRAAVADLSLPPATGALAREAETLTLGRALEILEALIDHLRTSIPAIESIVPSGEVRRFVTIARRFCGRRSCRQR